MNSILSERFSLQDARACVGASWGAYIQPATIATALCHCRIEEAPCGEATIVAFRGSASVRDWVTDFECGMRNAECGIDVNAGRSAASATSATAIGAGERIHSGFLEALLAEGFAERLARWWGRPWPTKPIYVTGHSLGGAMAILAAQVLVRAGAPVAAVYTFGGPRAGNAAFARNYNALLGDRTFRFVHEEDVVPRLPGWLMGFRHVGQELFLPAVPGGQLQVNPSLTFKVVSDAIGIYLNWKMGRVPFGELFTEHGVHEYVEALGELETSNFKLQTSKGTETPIESSGGGR